MACIPVNEKRCGWHDPSRGLGIGLTLRFQALGRAMTQHIIERALRAAEKSVRQ